MTSTLKLTHSQEVELSLLKERHALCEAKFKEVFNESISNGLEYADAHKAAYKAKEELANHLHDNQTKKIVKENEQWMQNTSQPEFQKASLLLTSSSIDQLGLLPQDLSSDESLPLPLLLPSLPLQMTLSSSSTSSSSSSSSTSTSSLLPAPQINIPTTRQYRPFDTYSEYERRYYEYYIPNNQ